eukprot:1708943-Prymnesium_polylepis.2
MRGAYDCVRRSTRRVGRVGPPRAVRAARRVYVNARAAARRVWVRDRLCAHRSCRAQMYMQMQMQK